jgi:hypothetical protein
MWLGPVAVSLLATISKVTGQDQKPLTDGPVTKPAFTVCEQSSDLCDAGARQFTGTVNVTEDKSMFFCTHSSSELIS